MSKTKKSISITRNGKIKEAILELKHCTSVRLKYTQYGEVYITGINPGGYVANACIGKCVDPHDADVRKVWATAVLSAYMRLSKELTVHHIGRHTLHVTQFTGRKVAIIYKVGQRWIVMDNRYDVHYNAASYPAAFKFVKEHLC